MTILVCGEALYDLFQVAEPQPGQITLEARVGGSPFNVAVGIARLGGRSALLSGVSRDLMGLRLAAHLEAEGVDGRYLVRTERKTTLSLVGLDPDGSPSYAFYGEGAADSGVAIADLPTLGDDVHTLHFGSYVLVVPPVADAMADLGARAQGRFVSLDPNVRPTIEPDMATWRTRLDALRTRTDLVKVSAEDLGILYPGTAPMDTIRAWADGSPALFIVTDGSGAVTAIRAGRAVSITPPPVAVVDTVGAGDAFQAAFLSAITDRGQARPDFDAMSDETLRTHLAYASKAAAVTCTRRGADLPTQDALTRD